MRRLTYVANQVRPSVTTDQYRTYYELNGNVYTGDLTKANAVLGGNSYRDGSTTNYSSKFQIKVNQAAADSLKAAFNF
ncbi:MAG: hypothetical protein ACR2I0_15080 [Rhodoferax sp.]